jgi:biopolymer transport protein ExbD
MRSYGRKKGRAVARLRGTPGLQLTSLMDILTTLLLFLLTAFVAGGDSITPPPGIVLPASTASDAPPTSINVAIGDGALMLGSERVASIDDVLAAETMLIPALDERLKVVRAQQEEIAALKAEAAAAGAATDAAVAATPVTIQGDRGIEFKVLERVLYTLQVNGYADIALAVVHGGNGAGS